jgi:hypothetical protein
MKYWWVLLFNLHTLKLLFSKEASFEVNIQVDSVHQICQLEIYSDSINMQAFCFYELQIGNKTFLLDSLCFDAYTSGIKLCFDMFIGNKTIERAILIPTGKASLSYSYQDSIRYGSYDIKWFNAQYEEVYRSNHQCIDLSITDIIPSHYNFTTQVYRQINYVYINVWLEKKDTSIQFLPREIHIGDGFSVPMVPGYLETKNIRSLYLVQRIRGKQMVHMGTLFVPVSNIKKYQLREYSFYMAVQYKQIVAKKIGKFYISVRTLLK